MIATNPLKPKRIYSEFSITRFIKEYDYPEFLFFTNKWYFTVKSKNLKQAKRQFRKRYPHQKILTVNKINKQKLIMNIKQILKQPISRQPISAQFIGVKPVEKILIKPQSNPSNYNEKDRDSVEKWLAFCAIGTQIIETGTKMLVHKKLIHNRDGIFDMIKAFKQLNKHFTGNENYDKKQIGIEDFVFNFLNMTDEEQFRIMKFQESLINKKR